MRHALQQAANDRFFGHLPLVGRPRGALDLARRKRLPGVRFVTDGVDLINRHRLKISFASRVMDDRVIPDDRAAIAVQIRPMNEALIQAQLAFNVIVGAYFMRVDFLDFARLARQFDQAAIPDAQLGFLPLGHGIPDRNDVSFTKLGIEQQAKCGSFRHLAVDKPRIISEHLRPLHEKIDEVSLKPVRPDVAGQCPPQLGLAAVIANHLNGVGLHRSQLAGGRHGLA